jgi:hypothetical protein
VTADLEALYRRSVRWYAPSWRATHQDALIGTLLDIAEAEGRATPTRAEQWNLAVNGLNTRLQVFLPAAARDGIASNAAALAGAFGIVYFFFGVWAPFLPSRDLQLAGGGFGPFFSTGIFTCVASCGLLLAFSTGRFSTARWMATATMATAIATFAIGRTDASAAPAAATNLMFLAALAGMSLIGAAPRPRMTFVTAGAWLGGMVVALALNQSLLSMGERGWWTRVANEYSVPFAAMTALVVAVILLVFNRPVGSAVTATATLPWLTVTALQSLDATYPEVITIVLHSVVVLAALAVATVAAIRLRTLPIAWAQRMPSEPATP